MLALKKKREEEKKRAEEEAAKAAAEPNGAAADDSNKVSLLGIGGKKTKSENGTGSTGKKRTPGEIRIQKGTSRAPKRHDRQDDLPPVAVNPLNNSLFYRLSLSQHHYRYCRT